MEEKGWAFWVCRGAERRVTKSGRVAPGNPQPVDAAVHPESIICGEAQDPDFSALSSPWAASGKVGSSL